MALESCGDIHRLPEEGIANALSLTTPKDVCRLSAVSSTFRSASLSDTVWVRFLPLDYGDLLLRSSDGSDALMDELPTKKDLYLYLCDHAVLIDGGRKSFSLDKPSGNKCFMLSARELGIVWGDTPRYWSWPSLPESRFSEVAELLSVCWLEISGNISTDMLSSGTNYAAYLVFKTTSELFGFSDLPTEGFIMVSGQESEKRSIWLDQGVAQIHQHNNNDNEDMAMLDDNDDEDVATLGEKTVYPSTREDGWLEVEVGEYFVDEGGNMEDLKVVLKGKEGLYWKRGIIVEGIEFRPKMT